IPSANRVLARLFSECDDRGIWSPKSLRTMPKASSPLTAHYFALEGPGKSPAQRQTDATFRLGLIARLLGIPVEVVQERVGTVVAYTTTKMAGTVDPTPFGFT